MKTVIVIWGWMIKELDVEEPEGEDARGDSRGDLSFSILQVKMSHLPHRDCLLRTLLK